MNTPEQKAQIRWALGVEYEGTHYHGWQTQHSPALRTIQTQIEFAIAQIANQPTPIICAGRTDRGVHALEQVIHFDTTTHRPDHIWVSGINHFLPPDIRILWAKIMPADFHARYSATARRYEYILHLSPTRPALLRHQVTWISHALDVTKMQEASTFLLGEHDFSSFRAADCQSKTAFRCIHHLNIRQEKNHIIIDIQANAFLHHMVRNITGVLLEIGCGKRPPIWAQEVLLARNRSAGAVTAPPEGLYLVKVDYPNNP